ncbi:class I tRNA ligase family protein, partial [Patescibacteria group bacterium]|nr:class I tRNA ligase family protein [Patescibacteria group bacterium]
MLHFYNTAGRKKEKFIPIKKGFVKMYTCGPTIYDHAHIGNLSTYLFMDILRRYLKFSKYKVLDVMNFTDVDDKTIKFSKQKGVPLKKYTKKFGKSILNDFRKLNINKPKIICKATKHIQEMINLIEILLKKGYAYQASDKSVYFNISKFRNYGKFAKVKRKKLLNGASGRILSDEYNKENVSDFVLWKTWDKDDGNVFWN